MECIRDKSKIPIKADIHFLVINGIYYINYFSISPELCSKYLFQLIMEEIMPESFNKWLITS